MRYDLSNNDEAKEAQTHLASLIALDKQCEIKTVGKRRSLKANAYLHLLLGICGSEWGYSLAEMKTIYKRDICANIYVYYKNDNAFIKSSADLNDKEMSDSIEQLKKYSAEQGLTLPESHEEEKLRYYENQIQKNERYL